MPGCPQTLHPTALQKEVSHHPWLDLLPLPKLRDNIIQALSIEGFDEDEFCLDVFHPGDHWKLEEKPALIVWGEAAHIHNWEVNLAFLRKWGWLLEGCPEILVATNAWRRQRGEKTWDNIHCWLGS